MKNLYAVLLMSVIFVTSACAGGDHDDSHGSDSGHTATQESSHDSGHESGGHGDDAEMGHDDGEGAHGHDEASPVGAPVQASSSTRKITVILGDDMRMKFSEDLAQIKSGEIIQFVVTNNGMIPHEFSVGNQAEQQEHAEMMRKMPGMTHSDGNSITLEPGKTGELTWGFDGAELVVFSCNIPGHYEAGMFKKIPLVK